MEYKNKIMIRKGDDGHNPCIVYVSHLNSMGYWVSEEVNTGYTHFSKPNQLIEFNYQLYMQMLYKWKIKNVAKSKKRFKKLLNEWGGS